MGTLLSYLGCLYIIQTPERRVEVLQIGNLTILLAYFTRQSLITKFDTKLGPIAQSVEQRTFNPWVDGSSPSGPTGALLA